MPKIPNFATEQQAADWFATHDTAPYMSELEEVKGPIPVTRTHPTKRISHLPTIAIQEITLDNLRAVLDLKVAEHQSNFVADNARSIAWSRYLPNLIPSAIYNGDQIVGFVLYGEWNDNPGAWGIARFMIGEQHQGKGYGKAAMQEVLRLIKEKAPDARSVNLSYVPENDVARKLYASVGFKETGEMWGDEVAAQYDYV